MTDEPIPPPPTQDLPPVEFNYSPATKPPSRFLLGWWFFGAVFCFWIVTAFLGYMNRTPGETSDLAQEQLSLKMSVGFRQNALAKTKSVPLKPVLDELAKLRAKNPDAARMYVVVEYEDGQPVTAADLSLLGKQKQDDVYREIYSSKTLSEADAKRLSQALEGDQFSIKLARAHAQEKAGMTGTRVGLIPPWQIPATIGLGLALVLILMVGLVSWGVFLTMRASGGLRPLGHPSGELSPGMADRYAARAATALALAYFAWPAIASLMPTHRDETLQRFVVGFGILAITLGLAKFPIMGFKIPLEKVGFHKRDLGKNILWGLAAYCANIPVAIVMGLIGLFIFKFLPAPEHPVTKELQNLHSPAAVLSIFFLACVVAPIAEETVFRGHIFPALSQVLKGPVAGAITSSLLFAAIHPTGVPVWLALASVGAMNCALIYQRRSIVSSMVLHAVHNGVLLTITLLIS